VGRDSKTAALVRYIAQPSNWSKQQGPSEFEHWLQHTRQSAPYPVANGPDGRRLVWTGTPTACPALYGWHVRSGQTTSDHDGGRVPEWLEEHKAERCTVDLDELEQTWRAKAEAQLAKILKAQAKYDEFKALPLIVLPD
jgi:hypothetical protein